MSQFHPYLPVRNQLSLAELREMASNLNAALKIERSRISVQKRARLDQITNAKQMCESGYLLLHPKFVCVVERHEECLFIGNEKLSEEDLLERMIRDDFSVNYFSSNFLNGELKDFCQTIKRVRGKFSSERKFSDDQNCLSGYKNSALTVNNIQELIVLHLCGIYYRVFALHPYLGGVGANEVDRKPNSPFGVFAISVLKGLGIRTRTGSVYAADSLKNLMPKGSLATSIPEDEEELIAARRALEIELENERMGVGRKQGRGRPRKSLMADTSSADSSKSTPARK